MRRLIHVLILALLLPATLCARSFNNETLRYKVLYKWGLINKTAGYADITMRPAGDGKCTGTLTAASEPWADRFFKVRDTLVSSMREADFTPFRYEKKAHEGNEAKHDIVEFTRNGYKFTGQCIRKVWKKGKIFRDETRTLSAVGTTVDMMSSFYYMRNLPYEQWQPGHTTTINIFSGKQQEKLTLKYQGTDEVDLNGKSHKCYHITFIFTGDGGKKTSDNMDAWISANDARIPLKLEGKLPVGKVQCFLDSGL